MKQNQNENFNELVTMYGRKLGGKNKPKIN